MSEYLLREVCEKTGVTRRMVQGYEKAGLVMAMGKNKYGYLLYDDFAVEKISEIILYQNMGFKIKEIVELQNASDEELKKLLINKVIEMKIRLKNMVHLISEVEVIINKL